MFRGNGAKVRLKDLKKKQYRTTQLSIIKLNMKQTFALKITF